ncbi:hypothetical protein CERSUDRAFT_130984 [Gelatoporia subvermispora B]|uniref:RRN7-type domain-containing protein n=1 Tax=Ceriporiopsis subvermispora (strain B) TaxID=914234 RepID=M2PVG4_CERS8|nr:hypothetical protein CERSUDRAFT_130984 [Gelatoporia subvermispora B]
MPPRRRCQVCGSKQWHKEPSNGLITCSEGHVLQNYRNETREVTELGPHALRKRALKSGRKRKERQSKANLQLYHGERARFHYFQCLQLVLRMQISYLAESWNLPPEFETICRDVWSLNLSLLPKPPPPEPLIYLRDGVGDTRPTVASTSSSKRPYPDDGNDVDQAHEDDSLMIEQRRSESPSSSSSSSSEDEGDDPIMSDLMREASVISTSSDEEEENTGPQPPPQVVKKKKTLRQYDRPDSTVAVLVLACWTLRLPVVYMDFVRLIEAYELPYLESIRLLPHTLTLHLTKSTRRALSPYYAPTPLQLHRLTSRLARLVYSQYGVFTPEMNAAPVLWRAVRSVCGTPVIYAMSKKIARIVSLPLTLHHSLAPLPRVKKGDPGWHKFDNAIPEASLIAVVIIVLKLVYGLDGKIRMPLERDDPACALPSVTELLAAIEHLDAESADQAALFSVKEPISALDFDDRTLDRYIAFAEKALLSPLEPRKSQRSAVTDFFPLEMGESVTAEHVRLHSQVLPSIPPASSAPRHDRNDGTLHPGEQYPIYNAQDILGTFPDEYDTVIRRAAHWAGVDGDYISGVVERFERRLVRWWGRRQKERET